MCIRDRHRRHAECCRAVVELWRSAGIDTKRLWLFAYEDGGRAYLPRVRQDADRRDALPDDIWVEKRRVITELYGFSPDSWEVQTLSLIHILKTRNALRPNNSPYEFSVTENGDEFAVVLEATDTNRSIIFSLADRAIRVRDSRGNEMFDVTLSFNDGGECRLNVQEKERELWQVRRMALEELLFRSY